MAISGNTHPLNSSPSKQTYSFDKAQRFLPPVQSLCKQGYYQLPSTRSSRTCSFGHGDRVVYPTKRDSPSPEKYKLSSQFDKGKGFSFGIGRDKIKGGPIDNALSSRVPGPGQYKIPKFQGQSFTLKSKLPDRSQKYKQSIPGPGSYQIQSGISKNGVYRYSKFKNSLCPTIHNYKTIDLDKHRSVLSPAQYQPVVATDPVGHYFLSKFKCSKVRQFSRQQRPNLAPKYLSVLPGPGSYQHFSQFGADKM